MSDLQLVPVTFPNPAPSGQQDQSDEAILARLLREPVPAAPSGRPAAGHCRFTMHYED